MQAMKLGSTIKHSINTTWGLVDTVAFLWNACKKDGEIILYDSQVLVYTYLKF